MLTLAQCSLFLKPGITTRLRRALSPSLSLSLSHTDSVPCQLPASGKQLRNPSQRASSTLQCNSPFTAARTLATKSSQKRRSAASAVNCTHNLNKLSRVTKKAFHHCRAPGSSCPSSSPQGLGLCGDRTDATTWLYSCALLRKPKNLEANTSP